MLSGRAFRPARRPTFRRAPHTLQTAIERLVGETSPPGLLAQVQAHWPEIAGEMIAEQATPVSERDGTITIACASSMWMSELAMMQASLLERLHAVLPDLRATGLRFVMRR